MGLEENKRVARRYWEELWNGGDLSVADAIVSPEFVFHLPPPNHPARGPEGVKELVRADRAAFSDLRFIVEDEIAEGDRVVTRWTFEGAQTGKWKFVEPTGKRVSFAGATTFRLSDGKLVEASANSDALGLLQQLGVIPKRP